MKIFLRFISVFTVALCVVSTSFGQDVEQINISGTRKTKPCFVKYMMETKEGTPLDIDILENDITRLKRMPGIAFAEYTIKDNEVNVKVVENFTAIPDINFWGTTNDQLAFKVGVREYNLLGRNISLGGYYQFDNYNSYATEFAAPNLFSRKLGLALGFKNLKNFNPVYIGGEVSYYNTHFTTAEGLLLYELDFNNSFQIGGSFLRERYDYTSGATALGVPKNYEIDKVLYKLTYTFDNVKYNYHMRQGFKNVIYLQHIKPVKDGDTFSVLWNDFHYYREMWTKGQWSTRVRAGVSTNSPSPFAPFVIDNNLNVRGAGLLINRGTATLVLNTEYRYNIYEDNSFVIQSNSFLDIGYLRSPGQDFDNLFVSSNSNYFAGLGVRFIHKKIYNAVFRIDYGHSLDSEKGGVVFGLGQYF